jgi:hypothetical protein
MVGKWKDKQEKKKTTNREEYREGKMKKRRVKRTGNTVEKRRESGQEDVPIA